MLHVDEDRPHERRGAGARRGVLDGRRRRLPRGQARDGRAVPQAGVFWGLDSAPPSAYRAIVSSGANLLAAPGYAPLQRVYARARVLESSSISSPGMVWARGARPAARTARPSSPASAARPPSAAAASRRHLASAHRRRAGTGAPATPRPRTPQPPHPAAARRRRRAYLKYRRRRLVARRRGRPELFLLERPGVARRARCPRSASCARSASASASAFSRRWSAAFASARAARAASASSSCRRTRLLEARAAHLVQSLGPLAFDGPVEVHQEQVRLGRRDVEGGRGRRGVRRAAGSGGAAICALHLWGSRCSAYNASAVIMCVATSAARTTRRCGAQPAAGYVIGICMVLLGDRGGWCQFGTQPVPRRYRPRGVASVASAGSQKCGLYLRH